jgi:hypothetical protein
VALPGIGSRPSRQPQPSDAVVIWSSSTSRARLLPCTAFRSAHGVTICNTTLYQHLSPVNGSSIISEAPGMVPRRRETGATRSAAGRVTAHLLLSFLALSASPIAAAGNTGANAQIVIPVDASPIAPLLPEPPAPAEHTFVSSPIMFSLQTRLLTIGYPPPNRPSDTSSITAPTDTRTCIGNKMSPSRRPMYGWPPRTATRPSALAPSEHEAAPSAYNDWWTGGRVW